MMNAKPMGEAAQSDALQKRIVSGNAHVWTRYQHSPVSITAWHFIARTFFFLFHFLSSNEHIKPMPGWHFWGVMNSWGPATIRWLFWPACGSQSYSTKSVLPAENLTRRSSLLTPPLGKRVNPPIICGTICPSTDGIGPMKRTLRTVKAKASHLLLFFLT